MWRTKELPEAHREPDPQAWTHVGPGRFLSPARHDLSLVTPPEPPPVDTRRASACLGIPPHLDRTVRRGRPRNVRRRRPTAEVESRRHRRAVRALRKGAQGSPARPCAASAPRARTDRPRGKHAFGAGRRHPRPTRRRGVREPRSRQRPRASTPSGSPRGGPPHAREASLQVLAGRYRAS